MSHQFFFSPHILDNLPAPKTGFDVVQDSAEPRLRMYVTSRGVKSFFTRKRVAGRDRRIIIGNYPDMEIMYARDRVNEVLKSATEKPKTHRKKTGFRKIADTYIIKKVRRTELATAKLVRAINRHLTQLLEKNVQDITPDDIRATLDKIDGPAVRNRMHELLHSIFDFAQNGGYVKVNPTDSVVKVKEIRRARPLNAAGFERLMGAIRKEKDQNLRAAFLMLVYGFAPKSKIFSMQWRDLDFNHYTWAGRPLSDAAVVLLTDLPQDGKWVFVGRGGRHLTDPRMGWGRVARAARIPGLTMDDVYKYMSRQLVWAADREDLRDNMNKVIESLK